MCIEASQRAAVQIGELPPVILWLRGGNLPPLAQPQLPLAPGYLVDFGVAQGQAHRFEGTVQVFKAFHAHVLSLLKQKTVATSNRGLQVKR
jgi:hypothetical protein